MVARRTPSAEATAFICVLCAVLLGCGSDDPVVKRFFAGEPATRLQRLETYRLEEQYAILSYGNQVIHPPVTELAVPFARRGEPAG